MPRPSLSYEAVAAAATKLKESGREPTLRNVRDELGSGSPNSIQPHLKKWNESLPKASAVAFELPGRVRDALAAEFARIAAEARVEAEAKLQQAEIDINDLVGAGQRLEEELDEVRAELARITTERDTLAGKNSEQAGEIARLNDEVGRAREETDQTRQKLARAEIRLEALGDLQGQNEALRKATAEAEARTAAAEKAAAVAEANLKSEAAAKSGLLSRALEAEEKEKAAQGRYQDLQARYEALHERLLESVNAMSEARTELAVKEAAEKAGKGAAEEGAEEKGADAQTGNTAEKAKTKPAGGRKQT